MLKLCNGRHRDLYLKPNIIHAIKSRTVRWVEHVAGIGRRGCM